MPLWVWATLGLFILVTVVMLAVLIGLGLQTFRALKSAGKGTTRAVEGVADAGGKTQRSAEALSERSAVLQQHIGQLQSSLDRLSVLTWALADARATVARVRGVIPRK